MEILGLQEGDTVEARYDLFQLLSVDFIKLKRLVFEFDTLNITSDQGDAILDFLKIPTDFTFRIDRFYSQSDLMNLRRKFLAGTGLEICTKSIVNFLTESEDNNIKASDFIKVILPCMTEDLFVLRKNYTVALTTEGSSGKWPEQLGNSFFIDSQYLIPDFVTMMRERIVDTMRNHNHG